MLWEFRNLARQKQSEEKIQTLLSKSEQSRRSLLSMLQDVKRAEEARRKSEERFRQLFDGAADALYVHDRKGRVVDVNRVGCDRLGYTREELLRMSVSDVEVRLNPLTWRRSGSGFIPGKAPRWRACIGGGTARRSPPKFTSRPSPPASSICFLPWAATSPSANGWSMNSR